MIQPNHLEKPIKSVEFCTSWEMALGVQRKTLIALVSLNLIAQIPLGSNISSIWKPVFINNVILRCAFSRFLLTCTVVCLPATPQKVCQGRPAFKCQISRFSRWRKKEGNEQLCWDLLDSSLTFKAAFAGPSARAKFNHYSFSILSCYKLWAAFFFSGWWAEVLDIPNSSGAFLKMEADFLFLLCFPEHRLEK